MIKLENGCRRHWVLLRKGETDDYSKKRLGRVDAMPLRRVDGDILGVLGWWSICRSWEGRAVFT